MPWSQRIEPLLRPFIQAHFRLVRGLTLGVRGVVLDERGRVLLVEHTYQRGWRLPGGGVERGESAAQALERELAEEAGVRLAGPPQLVSVHSQHTRFKGDHVLVYVVRHWTPCEPRRGLEIRDARWFDPADLPEHTPRATLARLAEVLGGAAPHPDW